MDKIKKLFKKLSKIEKEGVISILSLLASNNLIGLDIKKNSWYGLLASEER